MNIVITAPFEPEQLDTLKKSHSVTFLPQKEGVPLRTEAELHKLLLETQAEISSASRIRLRSRFSTD